MLRFLAGFVFGCLAVLLSRHKAEVRSRIERFTDVAVFKWRLLTTVKYDELKKIEDGLHEADEIVEFLGDNHPFMSDEQIKALSIDSNRGRLLKIIGNTIDFVERLDA